MKTKQIRLLNYEALGLYKRWKTQQAHTYKQRLTLNEYINKHCADRQAIVHYKCIIEDHKLWDFDRGIYPRKPFGHNSKY